LDEEDLVVVEIAIRAGNGRGF